LSGKWDFVVDNRYNSEKERPLTAAEKQRLADFEDYCEEMEEKGWRITELTAGIKEANTKALLVFLPFGLLFFILFFAKNSLESFRGSVWGFVLLIVAFLVFSVVHELLHGVTWGLFAENRFKDIEFGYIKEYFTPYCTCKAPLKLVPYLVGALMPLVILGIVPCVISVFTGSFLLLIFGLCMIGGAGGDVLISLRLLKARGKAAETLYLDHPTKAGSVMFEKD